MRLDDLIEEQTIESIAKKTNLTEAVITKLFNKDFKVMTLPQSMGALRIIEREYGVDLTPLRLECQDYFEDNQSPENGVMRHSPTKKKKRIFSKLLALILLIMLAYGAWYFFTEYYQQQVNHLDPQSEKSLMGTTLENRDTKPEETLSEEVKQSSPKEVAIPSSLVAKEAVVNTAEASDAAEENQSEETVPADSNSMEQNESLESTKKSVLTDSNDSSGEVPVVATQKVMVLLPQKIMWFRLTNLKNKEKREFKREERYEINLKDNNWLFATENADFAFINNDFFEEFGGEGKLFFRLDQEGIHQLSEDAYRAADK